MSLENKAAVPLPWGCNQLIRMIWGNACIGEQYGIYWKFLAICSTHAHAQIQQNKTKMWGQVCTTVWWRLGAIWCWNWWSNRPQPIKQHVLKIILLTSGHQQIVPLETTHERNTQPHAMQCLRLPQSTRSDMHKQPKCSRKQTLKEIRTHEALGTSSSSTVQACVAS